MVYYAADQGRQIGAVLQALDRSGARPIQADFPAVALRQLLLGAGPELLPQETLLVVRGAIREDEPALFERPGLVHRVHQDVLRHAILPGVFLARATTAAPNQPDSRGQAGDPQVHALREVHPGSDPRRAQADLRLGQTAGQRRKSEPDSRGRLREA